MKWRLLLIAALVGLCTTLSGAQPSNQEVEREIGTFAQLAQELKPSVVNLRVRRQQQSSAYFEFPGSAREHLRDYFQQNPARKREVKGQGSGVLISQDGEILTNHHVVKQATEIMVTLHDGREMAATVVGSDSKTDLALLKIEAEGLPAASLGDSDRSRVGDWVMAIGSPFGLESTVTVGVLSGKGRVIGAGLYDDYLQTDASINPGNSGGPLFNLNSEVIGINTAIVATGQGIGFAIPINQAREIVRELKQEGRVERGFMGIAIQELTPQLASAFGLPQGTKGAVASMVIEGGPAAKAGMEAGDVIVEFDGHPVNSDRDLLKRVARTPVGRSTKVNAYRAGVKRGFVLVLDRRPDESTSSSQTSAPRAYGLSVQTLDAQLARRLGVESASGLVVTSVEPGSSAERAGLRRGDLILRVGAGVMTDPKEFEALLEGKPKQVALLIQRGRNTKFVVLEN